MNNESAVLLRIGAVLTGLWLILLGGMKLGYLHPGGEQSSTHGESNLLASARDSDQAKAPTISSVLPSTLRAGTSSTVRISGSRLSGAFVTGSHGMLVRTVQIELDTLILEVFVDAAAPPGPASLTLLTGGGAVTAPIMIVSSGAPVTTARRNMSNVR